MSEGAPAFRAVGHRSLARIGLAGPAVRVALGEGGLGLGDDGGGRVDIPFEAIDRVRFGYRTLRTGGRLYDLRLWTHRAARPILLRNAVRDTTPGYAALARGLAAAVSQRRGIGSVEAGLDWGDAVFYLVIFLPFAAYGAWASIDGYRKGFPPLFMAMVPAITLGVSGAWGCGLVRLWRPHRLKRLADLEPLVSKEKRPWLF